MLLICSKEYMEPTYYPISSITQAIVQILGSEVEEPK